MSTVKEQAKELVEQFPDGAGWDELMYRIDVRQKIAVGSKDIDEERTVSHDEVRRRFTGA